MMRLEVNGVQYENFLSASVNIRLDALSNSFQFTGTSEDGLPLPFTGGESCKVIVEGQTVFTGFIESVDVSYSSNTHDIILKGRDKTGDLVDSTLNATSSINAPISLKQIIERVISDLGLNVKVIDLVNPPIFENSTDIVNIEAGKNAFDLLEQYSRKRQVLLTSDGDGNVVITQSSGTQTSKQIRNKIGSNENNIIEGSISYDTTGLFNKYVMASTLNVGLLNNIGVTDTSVVVDRKGDATDENIRTGRQLVMIPEDPFSNEDNKDRAEWEKSVRQTRSRVYSVVVDGFSIDGDLWKINEVITVVDDFAGIDSKMLVNSVSFNLSLDGSRTTLGLVNENAYTIDLSEPEENEIGIGLFR